MTLELEFFRGKSGQPCRRVHFARPGFGEHSLGHRCHVIFHLHVCGLRQCPGELRRWGGASRKYRGETGRNWGAD